MTDQLGEVDPTVKSRLLDLAYRRMLQSVGVSFTAPVIFVWLMQPLFPGRSTVIWLAVVWFVSLLRGLLWWFGSRATFGAGDLHRWTLLFWAGAAAAAAAWAGGAVALLFDAGPRETMMLAIMMLGVTAIGSSALSPHRPSSCTFILVLLAPIAVGMFIKPDTVVRIAGLAVVVCTMALLATVLRAHRELDNLFRAELRLSAAVAEAVSARAAAEEASVAKSAFLANMSHELRTPLNAILGYGEMLWEDARSTGAHQTAADLEKITSAGRHLLALINDVLDLSRIEAGRTELQVDSIELATLIQRVVDTSQTLAAAGGNQLSVQGLADLGAIRSDALKLQQVLLKLVGNACKFTSHGQVCVTCRRELHDPVDWIVIEVRDTGIGITEEHMGRLFSQFMQADSSATRKYGGTGLGLAISQRLCQLMGGVITVESRFGVGSTFTVRLPTTPPTGGSTPVPVDGRPAA